MSPSNFLTTNPVVPPRTLREAGLKLRRGARHAIEHARHEALDLPPVVAEGYVVGQNLAVSPGQVDFRNRLIIQYTPSTPTVQAEPVLIVPTCIMAYYVLDLTTASSMIEHLLDSGFAVFTISLEEPRHPGP